jgi:hypothetical protein
LLTTPIAELLTTLPQAIEGLTRMLLVELRGLLRERRITESRLSPREAVVHVIQPTLDQGSRPKRHGSLLMLSSVLLVVSSSRACFGGHARSDALLVTTRKHREIRRLRGLWFELASAAEYCFTVGKSLILKRPRISMSDTGS